MTYESESEDDIYDTQSTNLEEITNGDIEDNEGSLVQSLLRMNARLLADNQERALSELYDAAYIETASDEELDLRCQDIGIERKSATPATGVVEWSRDNEPSTDYTI
jgi:uncharacterized phage protein gp47/JayE